MHLDVRDDDRGSFATQTLEEPRGHVAQPSVMPAPHQRIEEPPARQRPGEAGIEEPVRVGRPHAFAMEAFPQAVPKGQGIEADPAVEPRVGPAEDSLGEQGAAGREPVGPRHADSAGALAPRRRLLARVEQEELEPPAEPFVETLDDAGVEEEPRREGVRQDEPDRGHGAVRARRASAMRSASEEPSRPWKRRASAGVPHAGQPSTPKTVRLRPSSSRRSESPSAPTGA